MKAADPGFEHSRLPFLLAKGQSVQDYLVAHQDRSKNAHAKSIRAAFVSWSEDLHSDQAQFMAEKLKAEKESSKIRSNLIRQLEEILQGKVDCHQRAWSVVDSFLKTTMTIFGGKIGEAESTLMPEVRSWVRSMTQELGPSPDGTAVILFINLPGMGILGASAKSFLLSFVTNMLADFPENSVALLVHSNRASQQEGRKDLGMKERGLRIRPLTWVFDPDSIYGKRDGTIQGLAMVRKGARSLFHNTKGWKQGCVHGVKMVSRQDMFKPDTPGRSSSFPHLGRAFTDVQEMKQAAAGTDFVRKTIESFLPATAKSVVLVDVMAYDGAPALAALEEHSDGRPIACGTIAIDNSGQELLNRIANTTYERCRNGSLTLPAFPNFEPHIQALKNHAPVAENKTYKVTSQVHDRLVILEALASKWLGEESTSDEAKAMIDAHNKEYNPTGDMLSESRADDCEVQEPPAKKIKVEKYDGEDLSKLPKQNLLSINNTCDLVVGGEEGGDFLYIVSRGTNQFFDKRELPPECADATSDPDGRWFSFSVTDQTFVIMESKQCPEHVRGIENMDKPATLVSIMSDLEDHGEVKLEVSHHQKVDGGWKTTKPICFVLDELQAEKKKPKKAKKAGVTSKNFGAYINISKLKSVPSVVLAWRCRSLASNTNDVYVPQLSS
ncbi:unnamed protein product [Cladocopium goreaui]|uniref:Uncharacterized protein n=1 Tax=Cladocopium goreaui TaxID=2562237 RepID=A0A9P1CYS9_9DINO|nr:unnamed protein product [Cladocopium goreaui]